MLTFDGHWHAGELCSLRMNPGINFTGQIMHVARICPQLLEAENVPVLPCSAYSPDMSPIEHVWDALDQRVWQRVPIPANIQPFCTAIERSGTTFHMPQSTAWSTLCKGDVSGCMRQIVVTPDTDWFSDPQPYLFLKVSVTNRCISVFSVMWNP
jgi:hypothetical protein